MGEQVGEIYYTVDFELDAMTRKTKTAEQNLDKLDNSFDKTDRSAGKLNTGLTKLASAIGAVIAASALRDMAQMVQSYQEMAERVQMATSSQAEFEMVQRRLLDTANGTYRSLEEAQELYIRTADSLRSMGYSTQEALDVTDSMSYAFVTNATSADRAQSAITALSKSINTGKVAADQWETITSAIPSIINDIAAASGRSAAEVRALGAAGKLTARELAEGLRQSLDATAEAASKMSNNLTDAGVRSRTALTAVLVALEEQTGALDKFTNGIITAADAVLSFAGDAENMAMLLAVIQTAAVSTAAVIAARLVGSIVASSQALYASTIAARAKVAADLSVAQSQAAAASSALMQARAAEQAAVGLSTHAAAARTLAAAEAQATIATNALAVAQQRMAGMATLATTALGGLRAVMAVLGGPAGLIFLAVGALVAWGTSATDAADHTDLLTRSTEGLSKAQRDLLRIDIARAINEQEKAIEQQNKALARNARIARTAGEAQNEIINTRAQAAIDTATQRIELLTQRLRELEAPAPPSAGAGGGGGQPAEPTTSEKGQERLAQMREELELAKLTGAARAKLQAIQRLGADATGEERIEAEKLAVEIYNLEEARRKLASTTKTETKSVDEVKKAHEDNAQTLARLTEELYQTTLSADALIARQAELMLNQYATPEQIEEIKRLNAELDKTRKLEDRKKAFGDDPITKIRGNVSPLSGGQFDEQTERYEAEKLAEQIRFTEQQARLTEALELQLVTQQTYWDLEEELYQAHNDRMAQIDKARQEMQLASWAQGFGQMAQGLQAFASTFASENESMFKMAKAAAIAQAIINTYQAATGAMSAMSAIPIVGPALGIAAAAAAVAGGMAQVANIRSQSMGGGRLYGGPVGGNAMHRINENGKPEIFNAANGRQFLLPNTKGEVVSNSDATGGRGGWGGAYGGSAPVTVNQTINVAGRVDNYTANQMATAAVRQQRVSQSRFGK